MNFNRFPLQLDHVTRSVPSLGLGEPPFGWTHMLFLLVTPMENEPSACMSTFLYLELHGELDASRKLLVFSSTQLPESCMVKKPPLTSENRVLQLLLVK